MASSTHAGFLLPQTPTLCCCWAACDTLLATSWSFRTQLGVLFLQEAQRLPNSKLASDPRAVTPAWASPF